MHLKLILLSRLSTCLKEPNLINGVDVERGGQMVQPEVGGAVSLQGHTSDSPRIPCNKSSRTQHREQGCRSGAFLFWIR